MGFFSNVVNNMQNSYKEKKAAAANDREYIRNNIGSTAAAEFIAAYFDKGNPLYNWVKENKIGVEIQATGHSVDVYYNETCKNPQSFRDAIPKKVIVVSFPFEDIFNWYGCSANEAFSELYSKTQCNELEAIIGNRISSIPHLKYSCGWRVKMFQ